MKKFTLHLDMIIVVFVLFTLSIGANIYQRHIHGSLHQEYLAMKLELTGNQVELINAKSTLKACEGEEPNANPSTSPAD